MKNRTKIAGLILIALLAGCSSSPKPSFYTLSTESAPSAAADVKAPYSVAVGPLTLPDMLDRPQLVVRVDANRVEIDEFHRWAGPLKLDMVRVITENMAQALAIPRVLSSAHSGAGDADFRVTVDVQRFDTMPGKGVAIEAAWTVRRSAGGAKSGHVLVEEPAGAESYDALVAAHSRGLGRISQDIAKDVQALAAANPG